MTIMHKPRARYRSLYPFAKEHVAGPGVAEAYGVVDCVDETEETLNQGVKVVVALRNCWFDGIKFDKRELNSGK